MWAEEIIGGVVLWVGAWGEEVESLELQFCRLFRTAVRR